MNTVNRLLVRLWDMVEGEDVSSINYQIARTLIENSDTIMRTSTAALAELCNVSKPSISRFCKSLGYDDFYDFRAELNQIIPDQGTKYLLPQRLNAESWMDQYLIGVQESTEKLRNARIQSGIENLAVDIRNFHRVYLMGNMQSGKTAESLHYNLHTVKKNIQAVTNFEGRTRVFEQKTENTLFVVFSVSGNYFRVLFPAGKIPKQSPTSKVWLITANPLIQRVDGVDQLLNLETGLDLASGNICLEMVANLIAFYHWKFYRN